MQRTLINPREGWQKTVESQGLTFHSRDSPYWEESAYYEFSSREIDTLEAAANRVHELYLQAAQHIIDQNLFFRLAIDDVVADKIVKSWDASEQHLYGRFDFAFNGHDAPKLLEYNADTPTSLLEASVIQWYWLQDQFPNKDQFNSLHESLIERWKQLGIKDHLYFTTVKGIEEDVMTTQYLRDTAHQAGLETSYIDIEDLGYDSSVHKFCDLDATSIDALFKLYPWEWMVNEEFGQHLPSRTRFIEPMWKMLWSNKGMLPILWELNPDHENLLPSFTHSNSLREAYVQKPLLSREGANISIHDRSGTIQQENSGEYGEEGFIYQQYFPLPRYHGKRPVLGVWMIGDVAKGMGIRESDSFITDNKSRFVPHLFE